MTENQESINPGQSEQATRLEKYFYFSRSPLYSVLFVVPLFLVYECLALLLHSLQITELRNGADVMLRQMAGVFGLDLFPAIVLVILAVLGVIAGTYRNQTNMEMVPSYFFLMFLESAIFAWMMGSIALNATNFLLNIPALFDLSMSPETSDLLINIMLSFGAGIHEEFFFRLVLIQALLYLGSFVFRKDPEHPLFNWNSLQALLLSSFIFSIFHYVGEFGDTFLWTSFLFRWVSGLYLAVLYLFRGFGVSAWTHALYDLFLILGILK